MKRLQLIEIGILCVVLILGFKTIEILLNTVIYGLYSFYYPESTAKDFFWTDLAQLVICLFGFVLLMKKSKWVAEYINAGNKESDIISLTIRKTELLYIIIIVLCIVTFVSEIARIIIYAFDYFKNEVGRARTDFPVSRSSISYATFKIAAAKLVLVFVLLYFAKPLSKYFAKDNNGETTVIESTEENQP